VARSTLVQLAIILGVALGGGWLVVAEADGWADWVVFAAILVTFLGFAIAAHQRVYEPRKRSITRSSDD
jgi:TRAP-type C4-dicarboxylate transport system permease small subunit